MLVSVHAIRHMAEWRYSSTESQAHQYKEVSGQLQALAVLLSVKDSRYPSNRMLSGPQNRSEYIGEEKYLLPCRNSNRYSSVVRSTVA